MFREMRRKKQKLAEEECRAIIERANSGAAAEITKGKEENKNEDL